MGSITPPPQTLPYPLCIVLVGGSLTSLLTATILLSLPTHIVSHVTILERLPESQLRDQGAGIRVGAEVRDAISRYCDGLSPEKYCTRLSSIRFVDREGNLSVDSKVEMWSSTWGQMHRVLSKRVEEAGKGRAAYRCGCKVEGIWERDGGEMVVDLRDDESGKMERLQCDFVVGADGTGSTVKKLMAPGTRRLDVGYVLYRGLVQQEELSEKTRELLADSATFHWAPRSQLISYGVPCNDGPADEVGKSVNWAWYQVRDQQEKKSLLTDKDGHEHKFSLPRKSMREEEQRKIKEQAEKQLPEVYKEMVRRTDDVFLQVITDSEVPDSNVFFDGKVVLIGDAVAGQRPHTASGVVQGLFHAEWLSRLVQGKATVGEFGKETQGFTSILVTKGQELGEFCMNDDPPEVKGKTYFPLFFSTQALMDAKFAHLGQLSDGTTSKQDVIG